MMKKFSLLIFSLLSVHGVVLSQTLPRPKAPAADVITTVQYMHPVRKTLLQPNESPFYVGVEGGVAQSYLNNRVTMNKMQGYFWHNAGHQSSVSGKAYIGVNFSENMALEGGVLKLSSMSSHGDSIVDRPAFHTQIQITGMDLMLRYLSTETLPGIFVRAGYAYLQTKGKSTIAASTLPFYASATPLHTTGQHNAFNLAFGMGYQHPLTEQFSVVLSITRYQNLFSDAKTNINVLSAGAIVHF